MIIGIERSRIEGEVKAPPSKSFAIRYVLLSLITDVKLESIPSSDDVTVANKVVHDLKDGRDELFLGGSATTLRMVIPILLALGRKIKIDGDQTLRRRPLNSLRYLKGGKFTTLQPNANGSISLPMVVEGKLEQETEIEGWESSQYVSGLIYAYCILGYGRIKVIPPVSSKGYIHMTADVINSVGGKVEIRDDVIEIKCSKLKKFHGSVPGDYALASFYAIGALITGGEIKISSLYPPPSYFGDHEIVNMIKQTGAVSEVTGDSWFVKGSDVRRPLAVSINDVPDLAPSLAGLMATIPGESKMLDSERLRIKESDRINTIISTLRSFGIDAHYSSGTITIVGGEPKRGEITCPNDHRIAMLAGDLALRAGGIVKNAECVSKSNPNYWKDLASLGAKIREI
ncbi:MAG: 3-phosphoshikimate 1-carboxyvinyltransferase [Metallosphaera sp.]|uniref:3-phosphoshikimate 1-carboxyvinyltransferase n=1 Tax=Metallosphaera sp. TaxID=2020860 RepID=UPI003160F88B